MLAAKHPLQDRRYCRGVAFAHLHKGAIVVPVQPTHHDGKTKCCAAKGYKPSRQNRVARANKAFSLLLTHLKVAAP